ncbi:MAG: hypothetical protein FJZ08_00655 [Candidatus Omnitrophica bacterium]|nr:hypothetical protein [Candidatus Omnitrophota bacterium]
MKTKARIILSLFLFCSSPAVFAQQDNKLVNLTKQIIESRVNTELYAGFDELKEIYFKDHRYTDFVEFLLSLNKQRKELEPFTDYYIALGRYQQLKYLEESQGWDEYFSQGNLYRDQISSGCQRVIKATSPKDKLNVGARLILWKYHQDQQDSFAQEALASLMEGVLEYAKEAMDFVPIKQAADELSSYNEKAKAKELYLLYVNKLVGYGRVTDEELKKIAAGFYHEKNLELSETIYDIYLERLAKGLSKEKFLAAMIEVARQFSYKEEGPMDAAYAEKVFQRIEGIGGQEAFNEELTYLRGFTLEKSKDYPRAGAIYQRVYDRYLTGVHRDEVEFKLGIIHTYIFRDIESGRSYFSKLSQRAIPSPQSISSLYQLGLLAQWQNDPVKAKGYYDALLASTGGNFPETVALAKERIKELLESRPIEYNLRTFLDVSLRPENSIFDMTRTDLRASPYKTKTDHDVLVRSEAMGLESGCMDVGVQYLWSGHLGTERPATEQSAFKTSYIHNGTKEINLVVVSPSGIIDRNIDMVDVYPAPSPALYGAGGIPLHKRNQAARNHGG